MRTGIDILENELVETYPQVFNTLLLDHTTGKYIIWATDNYEHLGEAYSFRSEILPDLITGDYGSIIMPRVHKNKILQVDRSKKMAEVFTPSWVCNAQNNAIDAAWFGREGVFNSEIVLSNGKKSWVANPDIITFPSPKTWQDYVLDRRLEITCGEAPYIASRYDTTTGEFIPVEKRIGLLDRKLRVVSENVKTEAQWLEVAEVAYKSTYAFEWQGDSLLIARESILITFIENFKHTFGEAPPQESIQGIAEIISWNVWQMDGLKGVIPDSCSDIVDVSEDLYGNTSEKIRKCEGCSKNDIFKHNGIYCTIMSWHELDTSTNTIGKPVRFVDLLNQQ